MNLSILRYFLALAGVAILTASSLGQGIVSLNNRTASGDVRIFGMDGVSGIGAVSYVGATAQLILVRDKTGSETYIPLKPTTSFQTNSPASTFFVNPVDVAVPGSPAGAQVAFILRVWVGSEWSAPPLHDLWGQSAPVTVTLGGTNSSGQVFPIPALEGLQSFTLGPLTPPPTAFFDSITRDANQTILGLVAFIPGFGPGSDRSWILQSSPDFVTWTSIMTNPPNTAPVVLTNENSAPLFFRLR